MLKVGNSGVGRRAASSHTGKMTADYTLFRTVFREGGYIEISDLDELADVARLVMGGKFPKGRKVGVLTGSGGWGVIMAEHCEKNGLELPSPLEETQKKLRALNSTFSSMANPIDMMANYGDQHKALECLIDDSTYDQFLIRSASGPDVGVWATRFIETASKTDKPIVVNWASIPSRDPDVRERIEEAGFLCTNYAGRAARAASIFTNFSEKKLKFDAGELNAGMRPPRLKVIDLSEAKGALSEKISKDLIRRYEIPTTSEVFLQLKDVLSLTSAPVEFPVAVKLVSPDIPHKTEANAVRLNVRSLDELKEAAQSVASAGLQYMPTARVDGISIQEMASGVEVILGAVNDPQFGPYVMVGLGGVLTEVLHDVSHRFAPVTRSIAREMISQLNGSKVLYGYRGSPVSDTDALAEAIVNLSWFISDHEATVAEVDINPIFVRPVGQGVVAADALVVMKG
jgi:acetyltransferase